MSISPTFYKQLFHTKVLTAALRTYIVGLNFFGTRKLAQKLFVKCWWNWPQMSNCRKMFDLRKWMEATNEEWRRGCCRSKQQLKWFRDLEKTIFGFKQISFEIHYIISDVRHSKWIGNNGLSYNCTKGCSYNTTVEIYEEFDKKAWFKFWFQWALTFQIKAF